MEPKKTVKIASRERNIVEVERFVQDIFDYYRIEKDFFGNIIIATTEAFMNAVVHGNKNNSSKFVTLYYEYNVQNLIIEVTDEGEGFSEDMLENPTISDETKSGLFLINMLTDNVVFHDNEPMISMSFKVNCIHIKEYQRREKLLNLFFNKVSIKIENE